MSGLTLYYDTYACTGAAGAQAPDLVLLHGWGLHSVVWDPVVPALLQHFQVTVIDLPGMGRSPLPKGHYDLDFLVHKVLTVAPQKATWLAWSLGAHVALAIAQRYPERVQALSLIAANACFVQKPDWPHAMPEHVFAQFRDNYQEERDGTLIRFLSLQCRGSDRMREDIRFLQDILYLQGLPAPEALAAGLQILSDIDQRSAWQQLAVPCQLILGDRDYLVPVSAGDAIKQLQPSVQLAIIEGSGHAPFLAQPEVFLRAFNDFVSAH